MDVVHADDAAPLEHDGVLDLGVAWDDPQIAADWGITSPELSDRDAANPKRAEIPERARPQWPMRT